MDKFDRSVQRDLLQALYDCDPGSISDTVLREFVEKFGSEENFVSNLFYLEGHGLINSGAERAYGDYGFVSEALHITAKGIDFVRDDGGLGAIVNVLTFRLHNETLDELAQIINSSPSAPPEDKKKLIAQLRSLPADAIKHLTLELLGKGMAHLPDAFHAIQTALRQL